MASRRKRALPPWLTGIAGASSDHKTDESDSYAAKEKVQKQTTDHDKNHSAKATCKSQSEENSMLSAEKILEMSYEEFVFKGSIIYSHNKDDCNIICEDILQSVDLTKETPIGFDTEWPVTYEKGKQARTALIQLCVSLDKCYLFHVSCMSKFPSMLRKLIETKALKKVGLNIENDLWKLDTDFDVKAKDVIQTSTIELRTVANKWLKSAENWSLEGLSRNVLKRRISKDPNIRKCDWRQFPLPEQQQRYAATDAIVSLMIYEKLCAIKDKKK